MLTLAALMRLANEYRDQLDLPVAPIRIGDRTFTNDEPVIMGTLNLSRDSTYRESIATSVDDAVRKGLVMSAQGAHVVDVGAESSTAKAARIDADDQAAAVRPVIERLVDGGVAVSIEAYDEVVAATALKAGAKVVNLTGSRQQQAIFELAAEHDATVVLCYVKGSDVREITDVTLDDDPIPDLLEHFALRVESARQCGATRIVIDPGMGFYYGNLTDPATRARHQSRVLLNTFRLRTLGLPICHALPHAFDLFGEEYRTAEAFFAVLASLGGTSMYRTHEVSRVRAALAALAAVEIS